MALDRLGAIDRDFDLLLSQSLTEEVRVQMVREAAQQALKEGQDQNRQILGYTPTHEVFYQGSKHADFAGVRSNDLIVIEFDLITDIIEWIDAQLIIHSPTLTGRYAQSHVWFADDVPMDPLRPPPAESYSVLNAQPYARKIERGLSPMAPDGVYEGVATLARQRFGNIAAVKFEYKSFPGGAIGQWSRSASAAALARNLRGGNPAGHEEWLQRQPSIYIDSGR